MILLILSFNECTTLCSRSLLPFDWNDKVVPTDSTQISTSCLNARTTVNRLRPLFPEARTLRSQHCDNSACCDLLAAGCSWMRKTFRNLCGGDYGGVVAETSVTVREIDRCVILVHVAVQVRLIACVWSRIDQSSRHSTPASGYEMDTSAENCATKIPFPWAHAVCRHWKSSVLYDLCTVSCEREQCASAHVLLLVTESETQIQQLCKKSNKDKTRHAVKISGCWRQLWACRLESVNTSRLVALTTSLKTRVWVCFTHHCSDHFSSCHLCWCHLWQLEVHEDELHRVELGDKLEEEDGWCSSSKCSAQLVLKHSKYPCSETWTLLWKCFLSLSGIKRADCSLPYIC